jgi:hypothetical protein
MTCLARTMIAAALAFCGGFALAWFMLYAPQTPAVTASTPLPEAPAAKQMQKDKLQCKPVTVYRDRPVPLPAAAPTEHATATGSLQAEERTYTLSATWDEKTGDSRIFAQPEPLPLFALSTKRELGLYYGHKSDAGAVIRSVLSQDAFKILGPLLWDYEKTEILEYETIYFFNVVERKK